MEKKEDSSSPVGVLEDYFRSEDSETCSSKEPTTDSEAKQDSKTNSLWQLFHDLFRSKSKKPFVTLYPLNTLKLGRRSSSMRERMPGDLFLSAYDSQSPQKIFSLYELQAATDNFNFGMNL